MVSFHILFHTFLTSSATNEASDADNIAAYCEAFVNYYLNDKVIVTTPKTVKVDIP